MTAYARPRYVLFCDCHVPISTDVYAIGMHVPFEVIPLLLCAYTMHNLKTIQAAGS